MIPSPPLPPTLILPSAISTADAAYDMYKTSYVLKHRVDMNDPPVTVLCLLDMIYFLRMCLQGDEMIFLASSSFLGLLSMPAI